MDDRFALVFLLLFWLETARGGGGGGQCLISSMLFLRSSFGLEEDALVGKGNSIFLEL